MNSLETTDSKLHDCNSTLQTITIKNPLMHSKGQSPYLHQQSPFCILVRTCDTLVLLYFCQNSKEIYGSYILSLVLTELNHMEIMPSGHPTNIFKSASYHLQNTNDLKYLKTEIISNIVIVHDNFLDTYQYSQYQLQN